MSSAIADVAVDDVVDMVVAVIAMHGFEDPDLTVVGESVSILLLDVVVALAPAIVNLCVVRNWKGSQWTQCLTD